MRKAASKGNLNLTINNLLALMLLLVSSSPTPTHSDIQPIRRFQLFFKAARLSQHVCQNKRSYSPIMCAFGVVAISTVGAIAYGAVVLVVAVVCTIIIIVIYYPR